MAKKPSTQWVCQSCSHSEPKWFGKCPSCGEWNTAREEKRPQEGKKNSPGLNTTGPTKNARAKTALSLDAVDSESAHFFPSGISELDRVLGEGFYIGSTVLIGGEPGIGKSSLMLQAAGKLNPSNGKPILFVCGEEALAQVKRRAQRLNIPTEGLLFTSHTQLETIEELVQKHNPSLCIVDSIQTVYSDELSGAPGSVSQMTACTHALNQLAKDSMVSMVYIAHITKDGAIAGPKNVEHMVDTVLFFEHSGSELRFLRAKKNRFGSTDEIGIFAMGSGGLSEVLNPSQWLFTKRSGPWPHGVSLTPLYEGSRILLVEIQALTVEAKSGMSRTYSENVDARRVSRIAAVLEKHSPFSFADHDLYVHVAGGMKIHEVACDLAIAAALYSARSGHPLPADSCVWGELSLTGEVRAVGHGKKRLNGAKDLGARIFVGPDSGDEVEGLTSVTNLEACLDALFPD